MIAGAHIVTCGFPGHNLCTTEAGGFGFVPNIAEVGDDVVVFKNVRNSMVVRGDKDERFTLIGESFVQGYCGLSSETDFSQLREIVLK